MHSFTLSSTQVVSAFHGDRIVSLTLPAADDRVRQHRIGWGRAEEIGTPAYWASQSWMWELEAPDHFRLGRSIQEETLACMLGGYGITAEVGLAAYKRLKTAPLSTLESEVGVLDLLSEPLDLNGRHVRYRFARQKAERIAPALRGLRKIDETLPDQALRDKLTTLPGIGPKTASWIVRNWRGSDQVAILDVHLLRVGRGLGIFAENLTVERHYRTLEEAFLQFAGAIGARASILDSVIWMTVRRMPATILTRLRREAISRPAQSSTSGEGRQSAFL